MISLLKKANAWLKDIEDWLLWILTAKIVNRNIQSVVDNNIQSSLVKTGKSYDEIMAVVETRGFYILPSVFSGGLLNQMRQEFRNIIDEKSNDFFALDRHEGSVCVRIKPMLTLANAKMFPALYTFCNSSLFRKLTKLYYKNEKFGAEFMTEVFVHETPETNDPLSGKLHWDRAQTLKFWVYLDHVSDATGPMIVEENTAQRNRRLRVDAHEEKEILVGGIDNVLSTTLNKLVPMSAPAGSVLIHNTDASHGASNVSNGMVRRIIRGHCRARK